MTSGPTEEYTNEEQANSYLRPLKGLARGGIRYQAESKGLIKGLCKDTLRPSLHLTQPDITNPQDLGVI